MAEGLEPSATPPRAGTTQHPEAVLLAAVGGYRSRLTYRALLVRLMAVLSAAVLIPLLVVVADHVWSGGLPRTLLRGALLGWIVGLAGALLGVMLVTFRRRLNRVFVARQLEIVSRIGHNSLVNALFLRAVPALAYAEDAALRQAARDVATHEPSEALEPRRGRRTWVTPAVTAAVWILYLTLSPKPIWPSLQRFFGVDREAPTATWLELVRPGPNDAPHVGEPLEIEIAVHGRAVRDVRLEILDARTAGTGPGRYTLWHRLPAGGTAGTGPGRYIRGEADAPLREYLSTESVGVAGDHRRFVLAPFEVQDDIHFRCTAGDARLEGVIPIEPQPEVVSLEIVLEPPAYSGRRREVVSDPDLHALAGTRATFRLSANVAVCDPVFVFRGSRETRTRMSVDPDAPRGATLALILEESGTYRIEFSDPWAVPRRDPPEHLAEVRPDEPPSVRVIVPGPEEVFLDIVDVARWPELVAVAEDDLGVVKLSFVLDRDGVVSRTVLTTEGAAARVRVPGRVETAALPLEPDRPAQAWFEATDGRVLPNGRSAPQVAGSRVLMLMQFPDPPANRRKQKSEQEGDDDQPSDDNASDEGDDPGGDREDVDNDGGAGEEGRGDEKGDGPEPSDQPGEAEDDTSGDDDDLEKELRGFVEGHGEEAEEVGRRLREKEAEQDRPNPDTQPADESGQSAGDQDSEGAENGPKPETQPAEADEATPETQPANEDDSSPEETEREGDDGGGQKPKDGSSANGDDVNTADPEDLKPPAEPPLDGDAPLGSTGLAETLDLLELLERGGEVTEDMLIDMGWPAERAAAFVRSLERLHETARKWGGTEQLRRQVFDTRVGDEERQAGRGLSGNVQRETDPAEAARESLRRIAPPAEQSVPENLRALLEAYYRSLAAHREQEE
ncbi:MAG: hypothetical protein KAY37_16345 [Phycisphaerae bacterium]|nr:hypothetical protein [Phycisphaerae bacterium]